MNNEKIHLSDNLTTELKNMIEIFYTSFKNQDVLDGILDEGFIDHMPFNPDSPLALMVSKKHLQLKNLSEHVRQ